MRVTDGMERWLWVHINHLLVSVEEVLALKNGSGSGRGYSDKYRSVV